MRITRGETIPVQVPIRPKLAMRGSLGARTVLTFRLFRIHTDEGITVAANPFTTSALEMALWDMS